MKLSSSIIFILQSALVISQCPFTGKVTDSKNYGKTLIQNYADSSKPVVQRVNYEDVMKDLEQVMVESKDFWPADYGNYGPLFIRLAWHNSGSYRTSDGRGGADGGRQRFEPERSWPDNTNLDKARALLWDIKYKYGPDLSWGDLFVLAGDAAIRSMGGHILGFCGGRVDVMDGSESIQLGPSSIQEELFPCQKNGDCIEPLGANTVGLIYVNPEGHQQNGDPVESSKDIRDVFGRMDMNDTETVALIGGGHAVGKCHGACPDGPGPSPAEDPFNPWPGNCGDGKLANAFTSGFELPFTTRPTYWDTEYYQNLLNYNWTSRRGPGNHTQWEPQVIGDGLLPTAVSADGTKNETIGLLTSDVALIHDDAYLEIVQMFAENRDRFDTMFAHAWYKLVTRDMGPRSRCINSDTAPVSQDWQNGLPDRTESPPDFTEVRERIMNLLDSDNTAYGQFTRLAWQCASSFRVTDYQGGCNGARLRHSPAKDWEVNRNLDQAEAKLRNIKTEFGSSLSWADLFVLAGTTALEKAGNIQVPFCGVGRVDDVAGDAWKFLKPRVSGKFDESVNLLKDYIAVMGLTQRQFAALLGAGYSLGDTENCSGLFCNRNSFNKKFSSPSLSSEPATLSNVFFIDVLGNNWQEFKISDNITMYQAVGNENLLMYRTDLYFKTDPELSAIAMEFAEDQNLFLQELTNAWYLLMNADMFSGPTGNKCPSLNTGDSSAANNVVLSSTWIMLFVFCMFLNI